MCRTKNNVANDDRRIKKIYEKYKEIILYFFFGGVTTLVSLAACYLTIKVGVLFINDGNGNPTELLDVIGSTVQWLSGVLVAFFTNKKWVFCSAEKGKRAAVKQFLLFSGSRVATYFIEVVINLASIALFEAAGYTAIGINLVIFTLSLTSRVWAKVISSVVVVISNYFISKLLVFKSK